MYVPRQYFGICSNLMTELANSSANGEGLSQSVQSVANSVYDAADKQGE